MILSIENQICSSLQQLRKIQLFHFLKTRFNSLQRFRAMDFFSVGQDLPFFGCQTFMDPLQARWAKCWLPVRESYFSAIFRICHICHETSQNKYDKCLSASAGLPKLSRISRSLGRNNTYPDRQISIVLLQHFRNVLRNKMPYSMRMTFAHSRYSR